MSERRPQAADEAPTVRADLLNVDIEGRVRLNTPGSIADLDHHSIDLVEGMSLRLIDANARADGIVLYSFDEGLWVVDVDWDDVSHSDYAYGSRRFRPQNHDEMAAVRADLRGRFPLLYPHLEALFLEVDPYDLAFPDATLVEPNPHEYETVVWEVLADIRPDLSDDQLVEIMVEGFRAVFEGEPVGAEHRYQLALAVRGIGEALGRPT